MNTTTKAKAKGETLRHWAFAMLVLFASAMFTLGMGTANAAPLAGTVIGNQATATYNDGGGTPRFTQSNQVTTTVAQVKAFTLTANGSRTAAPGQTVYYPHTLTNTGNGTDTYTLVAPTTGTFAGAAAGHGALSYYVDANGDGLPDNATPISAPITITAGSVFRFVVAGTVPATAANGDTATIGVAVNDTTPTNHANTDTTTVAASVITVNKGLSSTSGTPGVTIQVTLSYANTGTAAASTVTIADTLPAGMNYVASSATWNGAALNDTSGPGNDPVGIDWALSGGNTLTAIITSVPAGVSGNVKFNVQIPVGLAPGAIDNTATFTTSTQTTPASTNTATYTVTRTAAVIANASTTDSTVAAADFTLVNSAAAGSTLPLYHNIVWNKGNAADSFVISMVDSGNWPAGTTFTLYQQDGVTALVGSTTPSIPIYPGSGSCPAPYVTDLTAKACGYDVILKVVLPANAPASSTLMTVTKTARSVFDNTKSDTVVDQLAQISANTVDITNNAASGGTALGVGAGTAGALVTNSVAPSPVTPTAVPTPFVLYVSNKGALADNFNIAATTVPAGWSVTFYNDNSGAGAACSTLGTATTTTGSIAANGNKLLCAVVTVPTTVSGQANQGTYNVTFTTSSTTNGAVTDFLVDAVTVTAVHNVTIAPPGTLQTFPGGTVTYPHTVTNNGNVSETITWNALTNSRAAQGWTSAGYVDASPFNNSFDPGTDDVAAQAIPGGANASFTLAPGATRTVFIRVFASSSAIGSDPPNLTTVTLLYNGAALTAQVVDSTTVTDGLVLSKTHGTVDCASGAVVLAQTINPLPAQLPGACLKYVITGQNTTSGLITNVAITDPVPGNTAVLTTACATSTTVGTVNAAANVSGFVGTVTATVGTLTAGQSAVLTFCVQIAP